MNSPTISPPVSAEPAAPDPELRARFLAGMSNAAATVSVVTTDGGAGRAGVTVSAMASVSADGPRPVLLVCVHHLSPAAVRIMQNGAFCVNVLRDDQSVISDTFAGRFGDEVADKFDCADWRPMPSGAPRIVDPLVAFDCRVLSADRIGTHHVFFGEVEDIFVATRGSPLVYARRAYGMTRGIEGAASIAAGRGRGERHLAVGCFHTFGPFILPEMIERLGPDTQVELVEGDQRLVQQSLLAGETELALLYDLDLAEDLEAEVLTELKPYVLMAEGHALANRPALTPQDLAPHPMVLLTAPPSGDYFRAILTDAGVEPQVSFRSTSFEMVRGLVGRGLGYTLLATRPASDMTYDGRTLVARPLNAPARPSRVVLARKRGATLSTPAEEFGWMCREFFGLDA